MKSMLSALAILTVFVAPVGAADMQPLMTTSGKPLASEDFSGSEIPTIFRTLQSPDRFRVAEGTLHMIAEAGQQRSTHGAFMVGGHNLTMAFRVKFLQPGSLYIGIDGYKASYQGNTHLVRFSLTPQRMGWDQKRGGPESKHAISEANRAARLAKQPIAQPTAEHLADPNYFRTEELATREISCPVDKWHDVLLEVNGNELVAQVDGRSLIATAVETDSKKNRIGVGLTGRSTVLIDDVRVWENQRCPDWERVKARLVAAAETTDVSRGSPHGRNVTPDAGLSR